MPYRHLSLPHQVFEFKSVPSLHLTPAFLMITQFRVAEKHANLSTEAHMHVIDSLYCFPSLDVPTSPALYDLENSTVIALAPVCFMYSSLLLL